MNVEELIAILRVVPETKLRIFPLAWKIVDADGRVDYGHVTFIADELDAAMREARVYSHASQEALRCLKNQIR